jgi:hypothetical protein
MPIKKKKSILGSFVLETPRLNLAYLYKTRKIGIAIAKITISALLVIVEC